ncbi:hypothetical protein FA95DRAFT_1680853 [Auriscalpium vulgare]|uniref:Uncharacterized protein n=1 Tax=Auriscalpium vulgare TaxID=40419 RepID=A0ACB8RLK6_9AGAM|nr:hypothetical protein FA95DRAFT_1680853 [Auriscalpium vulgare]
MHHILAAHTDPFKQTFDSLDEIGCTFIANEAIQKFSDAEPKMEETATVIKVKEWIIDTVKGTPLAGLDYRFIQMVDRWKMTMMGVHPRARPPPPPPIVLSKEELAEFIKERTESYGEVLRESKTCSVIWTHNHGK